MVARPDKNNRVYQETFQTNLTTYVIYEWLTYTPCTDVH